MRVIGIDVGGTNTDAVLMDGLEVMAWHKTPTTPDVGGGIVAALRSVMAQSGVDIADVRSVMIGTTHFTNAVVERKRLLPVAAVRLDEASNAGTEQIREWVNERLSARYQKVREVVAVEAFPLSVAGKTLRRVLRAEYSAPVPPPETDH